MDCGKGVQTRNVHCAQFDEDVITPTTDESKCNAEEKPEASKECDTGKECPGQWFAGPWTKCSKPCGGGEKSRKVLCIANGESVDAKKCSEDNIAFSNEECNKEPCLDDEIIPVDATSKPIEADDESEDFCDDEEDNSVLIVRSSLNEVSDTIDSTSSNPDSTESTLFTDELMQSDETGGTSDFTSSTDGEC